MVPFLSATAVTALVFLACLGAGNSDDKLEAALSAAFMTLPPLAMGCLAGAVAWALS